MDSGSPAHIFSAMPLASGIFLDAHFTAPWCIAAGISPQDCGQFVPVPGAIIAFHYVYRGGLILHVEGVAATHVDAGEIVILPRNEQHLLGSGEGLAATLADDLIQPGLDGGLATIRHGGGGDSTQMICGFLGCERQFSPALSLLPRVMKLTLPDPLSASWFDSSLKLAAREMTFHEDSATPRLAKLTELLFIDAVQQFIRAQPEQSFAWLGGSSDPKILRALSLLQEKARRRWTAEELAGAVGMSRSAFAAKFTELIGVPPMRYLALQRLRLASQRLLHSADPLAKIAFDTGYESEAAFNRAFKKEYGLPPATWREQRGNPDGSTYRGTT